VTFEERVFATVQDAKQNSELLLIKAGKKLTGKDAEVQLAFPLLPLFYFYNRLF